MSRTADRSGFDVPLRLHLAEKDLDDFAVDHAALVDELRGIRRVLVGMLVSITTAAVLLAVNAALLGGIR